jgi:hypothetical protein
MNETLKDRLVYRRINVSFDIPKRDYEAAKKACIDSEEIRGENADDEFVDWIKTSIACGTDVLSFGTEETFTNNTRYYENEASLNGYEFRLKLTGKRNYYFKNNEEPKKDDDIIGTILMEFLVPVHKLLGVNFKCFVSCMEMQSNEIDASEKETYNDSNVDILDALFKSNFGERNDVHIEKEKLYFCFDFNKKDDYKSPDEKYGALVDYLYPQ